MNYYEELLLESNYDLYNDRFTMAVCILENFGIELPKFCTLESIEIELDRMMNGEVVTEAAAADDANLGERSKQAEYIERTYDKLRQEVAAVRKTKQKARAKTIMNKIITLASGTATVAGLASGGTEGTIMAMVAVPIGIISNISTLLNGNVREAKAQKADTLEWMDMKITELDENIASGRGNVALQKKIRDKIAAERDKIEKGAVGNAISKAAQKHEANKAAKAAKSDDSAMTGTLATEGYEFDEEDAAILESYGLDFLLEGNAEQGLSAQDVAKTKAEINNMKKKKDAKGLRGLCRKLGRFACKHKVAVGLFIAAATALLIYKGVDEYNYRQDVAELSKKILEHKGQFKQGELSNEELETLSRMSRCTAKNSFNISGDSSMFPNTQTGTHRSYTSHVSDYLLKKGITGENPYDTIDNVTIDYNHTY